jgi:hypothetical protein
MTTAQDEATQQKKDTRSPDSAFVSYFSLNEQGAYTRYVVSKPLNQFQEYDVSKQNNQFYATPGKSRPPHRTRFCYSLNPTLFVPFQDGCVWYL